MNSRNAKYCLLLGVGLIIFVANTDAQNNHGELKRQLNRDLKKSLRQSIIEKSPMRYEALVPELKHNDEVLTVSPNTKLPSRYDPLFRISPMPELKIDFRVHYINKDILGANILNYKTGKVNTIPNPRSIMQSAQYTRGESGSGIGFGGLELDPVRQYQDYKARKRKEKVDKIKKAYSSE